MRMRDGDALDRGALVQVDELGRGALLHVEDEAGPLRRISPVNALRAFDGMRGELLVKRAPGDDVKRSRPKSELVMRVPDRRVAFAEGSVRTAGTD